MGACTTMGGMVNPVPLRFAEEKGAEEIWVVTPVPPGFRRNVFLWKHGFPFFASLDPNIKRLFRGRPEPENRIRAEIEARKDLVWIRPEIQLPVSWMRGSRDSIDASIAMGKEAALRVLKEQKLI